MNQVERLRKALWTVRETRRAIERSYRYAGLPDPEHDEYGMRARRSELRMAEQQLREAIAEEEKTMTELRTREGVTIPDVKCEGCGRWLRPFDEGCPYCYEKEQLRSRVSLAICDCRVLSTYEIGEILDAVLEERRAELRKMWRKQRREESLI